MCKTVAHLEFLAKITCMPKPSLTETYKTRIKRTASSGEGIGDVRGFTLFVDGALYPEEVTVQIAEVKKNFARATCISFETPSPFRVSPPCPLFEKCGGCQTMHMRYDYQLQVKTMRVSDALQRIAKLEGISVNPCLPSPSELYYRNKVQMPIRATQEGLVIGFSEKNTHNVIDVEKCYIHNALGQKVYEHVRGILQASSHREKLYQLIIKSSPTTNQALVILVTHDSASLYDIAHAIVDGMPEIQGVVQCYKNNPFHHKTLAGKDFITEELLGYTFSVSCASFFQVNPVQAAILYSTVVEFLAPKGHEHILDAYCGVGTLSIILAKHVKEVVGVEIVADAIQNAKENSKQNGIENVRFYCQKTEDFIEQIDQLDACILNPPRSGCEKKVLDTLAKRSCPKIVYVSCDPATLARDLAILTKHEYVIDQVQPLDMFPQTAHVETIVLLSKETRLPKYSLT